MKNQHEMHTKKCVNILDEHTLKSKKKYLRTRSQYKTREGQINSILRNHHAWGYGCGGFFKRQNHIKRR